MEDGGAKNIHALTQKVVEKWREKNIDALTQKVVERCGRWWSKRHRCPDTKGGREE